MRSVGYISSILNKKRTVRIKLGKFLNIYSKILCFKFGHNERYYTSSPVLSLIKVSRTKVIGLVLRLQIYSLSVS